MKKKHSIQKTKLIIALLISLTLAACKKEVPKPTPNQLVGKWISGTEYYKYNADFTGKTWDTKDDVTEDEGKKFTWNLSDFTLTQNHIIDISDSITILKSYTITELTGTKLSYKDAFEKKYSFTKAE